MEGPLDSQDQEGTEVLLGSHQGSAVGLKQATRGKRRNKPSTNTL